MLIFEVRFTQKLGYDEKYITVEMRDKRTTEDSWKVGGKPRNIVF